MLLTNINFVLKNIRMHLECLQSNEQFPRGKADSLVSDWRRVKGQDLAVMESCADLKWVALSPSCFLFQGMASALTGVLLNSFLLPKGRDTNNALPVVLASRDLWTKWRNKELAGRTGPLQCYSLWSEGKKGVISSMRTANAYYSSGSTYTRRLETGHKKQQIALRKEWTPVGWGVGAGRCLV